MLAPPAPPLVPPGLPARPPSAPDDADPPQVGLIVGLTVASVVVAGVVGWWVWPRTAATPAHKPVSRIEAAYSRQLDLPIRFSP